MVRALAVLFAAAALAAPIAAAPQDSKSADLVKQLGQLLDEKKLDAIAAADANTPGTFIAALYFPGTQLLAVSAKYSAPQLLTDKLAKKDYRDVYVDLSSASVIGSKVFVMDTFADGLVLKPKGDAAPDAVERGTSSTTFDGDFKKAKLSEADYTKSYDEAEAAYVKMLQALIAKLKSGT
jgi:hypothetical protein